MNCLGCYTEVKEGYCLKCRKRLFDGKKVPAVLDFDEPKADNYTNYQQHSKHLSISGVQLKYSLRLEDDKLVLTEKQGQFILKPIPPTKQLIALEDAPENEHLTMQIAEQLFKITTAANCLIRFKDGGLAYLTKRFDVRADGSKYLQEDFAQLLNRTSESHGKTFKYDGNYEEIGELVKKHVAAAPPALERLFKLIVFNYVVSNGDAHLKNFSLIRSETNEYQLTPAYDVMSTIIHTPQESDIALDLYEHCIDSEFYTTYGCYGRPDFLELGNRFGLIERRAHKIIDEFMQRAAGIVEMVEKSLLSTSSKQAYRKNVVDKLKRMS